MKKKKLRFNSMKLLAAFLGAVLLFVFPSITQSVKADAAGQAALSGWQQQNGSWYLYENDIKITGWIKDNGRWYYIDPNGEMHTGWLTLNGKTYYLGRDGAAVINDWKWIGSDWYYFDGSGAVVNGWRYVSGSWYYFQQPDGAMMHSNYVHGYYLQANGKMSTSGNAKVVSVVNSLKKSIDVSITQAALRQKLGGLYQTGTDDGGYPYWGYYLKVTSSGGYRTVKVSNSTPPSEALGSGQADIMLQAYWDGTKRAFTVYMDYFDAAHKYHNYTSSKFDYQYN